MCLCACVCLKQKSRAVNLHFREEFTFLFLTGFPASSACVVSRPRWMNNEQRNRNDLTRRRNSREKDKRPLPMMISRARARVPRSHLPRFPSVCSRFLSLPPVHLSLGPWDRRSSASVTRRGRYLAAAWRATFLTHLPCDARKRETARTRRSAAGASLVSRMQLAGASAILSLPVLIGTRANRGGRGGERAIV